MNINIKPILLLLVSVYIKCYGKYSEKYSEKYSGKYSEKYSHSITLTEINFITLRGEIDSNSTSAFISKLHNKLLDIPEHSTFYVILDTIGGSVTSGIDIIIALNSIKSKYNIVCIADTAMSMGFTIFQSCTHRYVTRSSVLMQHQMSITGLSGKLNKIHNYLKIIDEMNDYLDYIQAKKMKLDVETFRSKIIDDWWIYGQYAIEQNAADMFVSLRCNFPNCNDADYIETSK